LAEREGGLVQGVVALMATRVRGEDEIQFSAHRCRGVAGAAADGLDQRAEIVTSSCGRRDEQARDPAG
jgi:hypothetical protein